VILYHDALGDLEFTFDVGENKKTGATIYALDRLGTTLAISEQERNDLAYDRVANWILSQGHEVERT
jgi:hypothetical protein